MKNLQFTNILFTFAVSKSWKSVKVLGFIPWKNVENSCYIPWKSVLK